MTSSPFSVFLFRSTDLLLLRSNYVRIVNNQLTIFILKETPIFLQ